MYWQAQIHMMKKQSNKFFVLDLKQFMTVHIT